MLNKQNLALLVAALPSMAALAADDVALPAIVVTGHQADPAAASLATSDTARLLSSRPGASVWGAGGVSALPVLRGLADDRLKVNIDGAESTSACGNHMNSPLSYVTSTQVIAAQVVAGISPVSLGGDNIGGVIAVDTLQPLFAKPGEGLLAGGELSLQARSVDQGRTVGVQAHVANASLSAAYSGGMTQAESYKDGHGNTVLDTLYKATNHAVTLAAQGDGHRVTFKAGQQTIPYQGYVNQYMDMTHNRGVFANLGYAGQFGWGRLEAKLYSQNTQHEMGFFTPEKTGTMPMNTHGRDLGVKVKAELPWQAGTLRLGQEFHRFRLDDWWPPVTGSMMMGPGTYQNIVNGKRSRLAFFGEWEGQLNAQWRTLLGLRNETVTTNAGNVQDYGCGMMCMADSMAAMAFNARDRHQRDNLLDATALATYTAGTYAGTHAEYELGLARKSRVPNLYERYTWGRGTMAMTMTGWFGDANGYVGNIDLKPETAHTLSATGRWHDAGKQAWEASVTPYFTYVKDYIDVDVIGSYVPYMRMGAASRALLQFANHDAHLYGINSAWRARITEGGTFTGKLDITRGKRNDGGSLYQLMPAVLSLGWAQQWQSFTGTVDVIGVASKTAVDTRRGETKTAGYALVNLGGQFQVNRALSLQAGVRNLFDRAYDLPLGGANLAAFKANAAATQMGAVPGQGRSIDVGMKLKF